MMYTAADSIDVASTNNASTSLTPVTHAGVPHLSGLYSSTHGKLIRHFTDHLTPSDLKYFRKWDRLIDLERHATKYEVAKKSWLFDSHEMESGNMSNTSGGGGCISSLVLDELSLGMVSNTSGACGSSGASGASEMEENVSLRFVRSNNAGTQSTQSTQSTPSSLQTQRMPLHSLHLEPGSSVWISTDGTLFGPSQNQSHNHYNKPIVHGMHKMHILKGFVTNVKESSIEVTISKKDIFLLRRLLRKHEANQHSNQRTRHNLNLLNQLTQLEFRLDKDEFTNSAGYLLQNLVSFFTLDIPPFSAESIGKTPVKTKEMTFNTEYSERRRRWNSFVTNVGGDCCDGSVARSDNPNNSNDGLRCLKLKKAVPRAKMMMTMRKRKRTSMRRKPMWMTFVCR